MSHLEKNQELIGKLTKRMQKIEGDFNSKSMCLAKWLQSTVYLMNGFTHSCHHPTAHKIPLEELENNPSALHNTKYKMEKRQEMLNGERPSECGYCWNIEDLPGNHISDRTYKSANWGWGYRFLDKVKESGTGENVFPSYVEVAFENTCNFKCMYCRPEVSSKWMEEIKDKGPYKTSWPIGDLKFVEQQGMMPIPNREDNPYINAFWKWWPELYQNVDTFRVTGGEPLLSKNTWKVLEWIKNNPKKDFNFAVNTNMGVPDQFIDKLISYTQDVSPNMESFEIYTSCEAHGKQAEFIRHGLDYDKYVFNMDKVLSSTEKTVKVSQMITINALSISTFDKYLEDILLLRNKYNIKVEKNRIPIMIAYLRYPYFQDIRVLPYEIKQEFENKMKSFISKHLVTDNPPNPGYIYLEEQDQVNRLCEYMYKPIDDNDLHRRHKDFGIFYKEYCERKSLNFEETFPELVDFYHYCLNLS